MKNILIAILHALQKLSQYRKSIWTILSVLTVCLILPWPWQRVPIITSGELRAAKTDISFPPMSVQFKSLGQIILTSFDFPSTVRYYNLHLSNIAPTYDFTLYWALAENNPLLPYFQKTLTTSTPRIVGAEYSYAIQPNTDRVIKAIPIQVPIVDDFGLVFTCGFDLNFRPDSPDNRERCPKDSSDLSVWPVGIDVFATPNGWSWVAQFILIWIFWAVAISSIRDFFTD